MHSTKKNCKANTNPSLPAWATMASQCAVMVQLCTLETSILTTKKMQKERERERENLIICFCVEFQKILFQCIINLINLNMI
jgi:hypothetical protein